MSYNPWNFGESIALVIEDSYKNIGIEVDLEEWGFAEDPKIPAGEYDLFLGLSTIAYYADTDSMLYSAFSEEASLEGSYFYAVARNPTVATDLQQARASLNATERDEFYQRATWLLHKEVPILPLVIRMGGYTGAVKGLSGVLTHPLMFWHRAYANVSKPGVTALIVGEQMDALTLDPAETGNWGPDLHFRGQIYNGLYGLPEDALVPAPALATNYSVSSDATEWTFSLRQGVTFHDGTSFNASDVVFTFERMEQLADESSPYVRNGWAPEESYLYDTYIRSLNVSVAALSEYQVKFTLENPFVPFLEVLATPTCGIVSDAYVIAHNGSTNPDRLALHPVGTGPYQFKEWIRDQTLTLERFDDYWGAPAKTQKLVFKIIPESSTMLTELLAETIHVAGVVVQDHEAVESAANLDLLGPAVEPGTFNILISSLRAPFNNNTVVDDPDFGGTTTHGALLRRALLYAIDREKIVEAVFFGHAEVAGPYIPSYKGQSRFLGFNASIEPYPYDPEKARSIIQDLGYKLKEKKDSGFDPFFALVSTVGAMTCILVLRKRR